ncbi:hypothetical protein [Pelagicoccus sp. SDUM812005]|uniref:hypothetical protein n=1 Tax=Pelagicoccus sp. SDUM812005 TaxID=3041257 RepID=UPI00280C4111|nr:hypothetical protein [Pelagicoccus sp. SDUM812005]MDQ8180365.1 hypothetical protein [Pelagicoccus sp. SDUM812005]
MNLEGADDAVACYYLPTTTISRLLSGDLTTTRDFPSELIEEVREQVIAAMPGLIESAISAARKALNKAEQAIGKGETFEEPVSIKPQAGSTSFFSPAELKGYLKRYEASTSERIMTYLVVEILTFLAKKETRRKAARAYADKAGKADLRKHAMAVIAEVVKTGIAKPFTVDGENAQ